MRVQLCCEHQQGKEGKTCEEQEVSPRTCTDADCRLTTLPIVHVNQVALFNDSCLDAPVMQFLSLGRQERQYGKQDLHGKEI